VAAIRSQTGSSPNYWLFTGEQRDAGSSLYYLRARYYDPSAGRFLGRDPIMAAEPYAYVGNNPVNFTDPSGLCRICMPELPNCFVRWFGSPCGPEPPDLPDPGPLVDAVTTGYVDAGGTLCVGPWFVVPCASIGVQFGVGQGVHPYVGGGGGTVGGGVGITLYPHQQISEGLTCSFQGAIVVPVFGNVGPGVTVEGGLSGIGTHTAPNPKESKGNFTATGFFGAGPYIGTPGGVATCYYVLPAFHLP
jgi:RHS repeat-associated protein